jgi:uroporphyrinogen-III synthase
MGATVLITREERPGERELGEELGLRLVFVPLTSSKTLDAGRQTPETLATNHNPQTTHIAFTSRNAVEALRSANLLNELRGKNIWCVGPSTASALGDIPHHVSPGTTGEDLARFMIESGVSGDVLHICGEPHRPELRATLERAGCDVKEWIVYETVPVEAELPKEPIDAVAFFSPAAVKQFKALGWTESLHVPYVAIGPTTAYELSPSTCTVSSEASFRGALETTRRILNVQL